MNELLYTARPTTRWEYGLVAVAAGLALCLGFANLGLPSLWHDELVHIYVSKSILDRGWPQLPSGNPYVSGAVYSFILAGFIGLFGDSEIALRAPSVLMAGVNVVLTFVLVRRLLGRSTALTAAFFLALSPWSIAWSRQARFYELQQTLYLIFMLWGWRLIGGKALPIAERGTLPKSVRNWTAWALGGTGIYALGVLTALHSVLFVAPIGVYAFVQGVRTRRVWTRWTAVCCLMALFGGSTLAIYRASLPEADANVIFSAGRLGGQLPDVKVDRDRSDRFFYLRWLKNNLSAGYFVVALFGFGAMVWKEGRRGLYAALGFWAPVLILTYLVGYRRDRFMYFTYPFYAIACAYGMVFLAQFLSAARRSRIRLVVALLVLPFVCRLAYSTVLLLDNSLDTARGADVTLAVKHLQWRKPCLYVRDHRDGAAVIATSYLPPLYYVGHIDDWYPSRIIFWEAAESGLEGLKTLADLQRFVQVHPKGYFIAEWQRFGRWPQFADDLAWVETHMRRLDDASGEDVTLYAWGM